MALPRGGDRPTVGRLLLLFLVLLLALRCAEAQPSWPSLDNTTSDGGRNNNNNNNSNSNSNSNYGFKANFNPSMAIVIVILVSAFFFLGFFSIYIRQCGGVRGNSLSLARAGIGGAARSRPPRGLDLELLATFPTIAYSEVKGLKIGKGALECAVCLCEFEDDETLRLLPKCSHVFHPDCIDAWLASHVTCPVCRSNLADVTPDDDPTDPSIEVPAVEQETAPPDHVAIAVGEGALEERKAEQADLARIASLRRGARFPRSHSTGHSLVLVQQQGDNNDRFTLRLPEHIRREIVATGRMRRAESVRSFLVGGLEGSSRRGYRGDAVGEGSIRRGRSIRLGRSDRWPSFFIRNLSARMPAWASGRAR